MSLRFLQFSDVHLDAGLVDSKLKLGREKIELRKSEIRGVVKRACELAAEEKCDLILIPGDLFDQESAHTDTVRFLVENFSRLAPMPIIIAPGNHDFYSPSSRYSEQFLRQNNEPLWPDNVHIFTSGEFEIFDLPTREDVAVVGISHLENSAL